MAHQKEKPTMASDVVKQIQKATRRKITAEEKIRVVLEGLRGETCTASAEVRPIGLKAKRHFAPKLVKRF
jgi:hypothetical protein